MGKEKGKMGYVWSRWKCKHGETLLSKFSRYYLYPPTQGTGHDSTWAPETPYPSCPSPDSVHGKSWTQQRSWKVFTVFQFMWGTWRALEIPMEFSFIPSVTSILSIFRIPEVKTLLCSFWQCFPSGFLWSCLLQATNSSPLLPHILRAHCLVACGQV